MVALIGIDCATQPNKVGLALGQLDGGCVRIKVCRTASPKERPETIVAAWLLESGRALLALDAPLGWPLALQQALAGHQAGEAMGASAHALFRRRTDDDIHKRFGKRPLEVGANFISRTAVAALELLQKLRTSTGMEIPLAWSPLNVKPIAAIEVYPAATRLAHRSPGKGGSIEGFLPWAGTPPCGSADRQAGGLDLDRGPRPAAALQPTWEPSRAPRGIFYARCVRSP